MRRLVIQRRVDNDLYKILIYSAREWGFNRAERYIREIYAIFDRVRENPALGRALPRTCSPFRRVNVGSHAVFFTASETQVTVVRVLHQRRDIPKHLR